MKRLHVHVNVDDLAPSIRFYSTLFAVGSFLFGAYGRGLLCVAVAAVSVWLIHRDLTRRGFAPVTPSTPW